MAAAALAGLLAVCPAPIVETSAADAFVATGERVRTPGLGTELVVRRDPATGRKDFVSADGSRFDSLSDAILDEQARLPPIRRVVDPSLWEALDVREDDATLIQVTFVLRAQPLAESARAARDRVAPHIEARLARLRAALAEIAPARVEDPVRALKFGDRLEEEARLLGTSRREELRAVRREIAELVQHMRRDAVAVAAPLTRSDQVPVVARILDVPGARVLGSSIVLSAVTAEIPAGRLRGLVDSLPQVAQVLPHAALRPSLDVSVPTVGASPWTSAGYDGATATRVAVVDMGVDADHPALQAAIGAQNVFLSSVQGIAQNPEFIDDVSSTDDFHGHGTLVAGIVVSNDTTRRGVSPGITLLNAKCGYAYVVDGTTLGIMPETDVRAALDWAGAQGADVVNVSYGGTGQRTDGTSTQTYSLDKLGAALLVSVAVGAGNAGPNASTMSVPGDAFNAVTVGALDDAGTTSHGDNVLAAFSGRGPCSDGRRKPDLCAPGVNVTSCSSTWEGAAADFAASDGTSFATPHVAGAMALLLDYASSWRPEGIRALLVSTTRNASPYPTAPDSTWGHGALDLAAAFTDRASVLEGSFTPSGPAIAFVRTGPLLAGGRATLATSRVFESLGSSTAVPVDLDLFVYDGSSGSALGLSTVAAGTIEQVALAASSTAPVLKIRRVAAFPYWQSSAPWAVAAETAYASSHVSPPTLSCTFTAIPAETAFDAEFDVTVTVVNAGELAAPSASVALTLPAGYQVTGGANPASIGNVAGSGSTAAVTWRVRSGTGSSGTRTFSARVTASAFGETFASSSSPFDQILDGVPPVGSIAIADGAAAVAVPDVNLRVVASDEETDVTSMRFRDAGGTWGPWLDFASSHGWLLPDAEGAHTVEAQFRDAAGNESAVAADSTLVDWSPPSGSFRVAADAPYVLPWDVIYATTSYDDGAGSGVTEFRHRWSSDGAWSPWTSPPGPLTAMLRPETDGPLVAEGQFRDAAGNVSESAQDEIHFVETDPPPVTHGTHWRGALGPGGDVDAFTLAALAGESVRVTVAARPTARGAELAAVLDVFDPAGERIAGWQEAAAAKRKNGAARTKFTAAASGAYWLVLRATGGDAYAGGACKMVVEVRPRRRPLRIAGTAEPVDGWAEVPFEAVAGAAFSATLRGELAEESEIADPGGTAVAVRGDLVAEDRLRIRGHVLGGGAGTFVLRIPTAAPVRYALDVRPPRGRKSVEDDSLPVSATAR